MVRAFQKSSYEPCSQDVIPERHLPLEIPRIHTWQRPQVEEELVTVGGPVPEFRFAGTPEECQEVETRGEEERAVVMEVVPDKPVRHRRLRGDGLNRGMRINGSHGSVEARVRDAPDANIAVVIANVLDEPVNGVVGIGGLVDVPRTGFMRNIRPHIHEIALRIREYPSRPGRPRCSPR